jgi:predicted metal-dependent HD superfamily phosphohydrolase
MLEPTYPGLFFDADVSILGAPPDETYQAYSQAIYR